MAITGLAAGTVAGTATGESEGGDCIAQAEVLLCLQLSPTKSSVR